MKLFGVWILGGITAGIESTEGCFDFRYQRFFSILVEIFRRNYFFADLSQTGDWAEDARFIEKMLGPREKKN